MPQRHHKNLLIEQFDYNISLSWWAKDKSNVPEQVGTLGRWDEDEGKGTMQHIGNAGTPAACKILPEFCLI